MRSLFVSGGKGRGTRGHAEAIRNSRESQGEPGSICISSSSVTVDQADCPKGGGDETSLVWLRGKRHIVSFMEEITLVWAVGETPRWVPEEASWPGGCTGHLQENEAAAASPCLGEVVKGLCYEQDQNMSLKRDQEAAQVDCRWERRLSRFLFFPFHEKYKENSGRKCLESNPFLFPLQSLFNHCDPLSPTP